MGVSAQRWDLLLRDAVLFVRLPLPTSAAFMCAFSHLSLEGLFLTESLNHCLKSDCQHRAWSDWSQLQGWQPSPEIHVNVNDQFILLSLLPCKYSLSGRIWPALHMDVLTKKALVPAMCKSVPFFASLHSLLRRAVTVPPVPFGLSQPFPRQVWAG